MTHESSYGADGRVTDAQKLAELACERQAARDGKALVHRFWATPTWKRAFASQIQAANKLLKIYAPDAVFAMLRANPSVYSLGPGWVADKVGVEQAKIDRNLRRAGETGPIEARSTTEAPRQGVSRSGSVRSRLKEL